MTSKINRQQQRLLILWAAVLLMMAAPLRAEEALGPGEIIAATTDRIMAIVEDASSYFDEDPERYYRAIGDELIAIVDFRSFARGVMGEAASTATYRSLDEEGKTQLRAQLDRFTEVIQAGLIRTYGKGLLAFGGSRTEVAAAEVAPNSSRIASVTQRVFGDEDTVYTLRYQMGQYRDGSWKLRNMIIESVNLGQVYRSQFEEAMDDADGDIDRVIDQWNTDVPDSQ